MVPVPMWPDNQGTTVFSQIKKVKEQMKFCTHWAPECARRIGMTSTVLFLTQVDREADDPITMVTIMTGAVHVES